MTHQNFSIASHWALFLFQEDFVTPNLDDFTDCDLVFANPIRVLNELTMIPEEPAQEPTQEPTPQEPTPQEPESRVTVRTSVCGAEFRF